mgnify:CR=1 FL=1
MVDFFEEVYQDDQVDPTDPLSAKLFWKRVNSLSPHFPSRKSHSSSMAVPMISGVGLTPEIIVICNDEGKIQQLPPNRAWVESSGVVDFFASDRACFILATQSRTRQDML